MSTYGIDITRAGKSFIDLWDELDEVGAHLADCQAYLHETIKAYEQQGDLVDAYRDAWDRALADRDRLVGERRRLRRELGVALRQHASRGGDRT